MRRLAWRHFTGEPGSAAALVIAVVAALSLPALPLLIDGVVPSRPSAEALAGAGSALVVRSSIADAGAFDAFQRAAQRQLSAVRAYTDAGAEFADAGSLRIDSVNGQAPPAGALPVRATYTSDLGARIQIVKGEPARPVANSLQGSISMPIDAAGHLGLGLGDLLCVGAGGDGTADWCARLVGLWRPLAAGEPYWRGRLSAAIFTDRDDFFSLLAQTSRQGATAGRWYTPRSAAITATNAAGVADSLRGLRETIARSGTGALETDLDRTLDRYAATGRLVTFSVRLLSAALVVLAVLLVVAMAGHFLDIRAADLSSLRSRGWTAGRVRQLALTELVVALLLGLTVTAIIALPAALILAHSSPFPDGDGGAGSPIAVAVAVGVTLAAILICLAGMAARPLRGGDACQDGPRPRASTSVSQRLIYVNALLAAPAASLFFLPDRLAVQRWPGGQSALEADRFAVFVAALLLLSGAAFCFLPPAAIRLARLAPGPAGALAGLRLGDWRRRNIAAGFLLIFASALASFAAGWLAALIVAGSGTSATDSMQRGLVMSLAVGFAVATLTVLAVSGLLARSNARARAEDDASLLLDGLPARILRRAHRTELRLVLGLSAVAGGCLGLTLALGMGARAGDASLALSTAALALGLTLTPALLLAGGLLFGRLARPALPRVAVTPVDLRSQ